MVPTSVFADTITALLAANVAQLAAAAEKLVTLIISDFTPGPGTDLTTLTPATFDGSTPLEAPSGAQLSFTDAGTNRRIVQLVEPAGGWYWITTGTTDLPQVVYGYVVTNAAGTVTYGSYKFPTPITLTAVGQAINVDTIRFTQVVAPLS